MDGMHSCAYIPRHTYRMLYGLMCRELERDAKAENSLRFLWSRVRGGGYVLTVNPQGVDMARTNGLAGLEPEWCGRMQLARVRGGGRWLAQFELKPSRKCK